MMEQYINKITSPYALLVVSIVILLIGRVVFKKTYLNIFDIIIKHLECYKKTDERYSIISLMLYYVVPALIAWSLIQIKQLDSNVVNILTVIISILTSMLFTMLTLIIDMRKRIVKDERYNANEASVSAKVLRETYYSIMFEILICILILMMCFIELFSSSYTLYASFVIYYLVFVLLMNLLMVLKRIFKVIDYDMKVTDR